MKKSFVVVIMLFFSIITVSAQSNNILIGVAPIVRMNIENGNESNTFSFNLNPTYSASLGYEIAGNGAAKLFEAYYTRGTVSNFKLLKGEEPEVMPMYNNIGSAFGLAGHMGRVINPGRRLQIPVYYGLGLGYADGPMNGGFEGDLRLKLRIKFYITDKVGLYAGGHTRLGIGLSSLAFRNSKPLSIFTYGAEAGLIIALNKTYIN